MKSRNQTLDIFKGIAIIAVILYHANLFTYGYLGVEIFLVVGGYLITKSILRAYENGQFNYWNYLCNRLVRLWPLALLLSVLALIGGYFTMLPDAYKNTCETAVGTSTFTNNFVQYITAGDYWDTANEYKPLMHTWYLGVIFQFYVLYPFVFMLCHRFSRHFVKASILTLSVIFLVSLALFVLPLFDTAYTFYLLPARLFEFAAGGIVALTSIERSFERFKQTIIPVFFFLVVILLFVNDSYDVAKVRLLLTVAVSVLLVIYSEYQSSEESESKWVRWFSVFVPFGMASYSLYLWHQFVLAFYRYVFNDDFTVWSYILTLGLSLLIGYLSYRFIEKVISSYTKKGKKQTYIVLSFCLITLLCISYPSLKIYARQGVVRDIPELEVYLNDPKTYSPQEYNARISSLYDKDFPKNGKTNVLVVGDSYARDWMNVLLEGGVENAANLSYHQDKDKTLVRRIRQADVIFVANHGPIDIYIDYLPSMMKKKFYRVGDKFFGQKIGVVYNHPKDSIYYKQRVSCPKVAVNEDERIEYKGMYINMMDSIRNADGSISMFTSDKKLISHDGLHLTKAGAKLLEERMKPQELCFH